jgi:hypothetical protein
MNWVEMVVSGWSLPVMSRHDYWYVINPSYLTKGFLPGTPLRGSGGCYIGYVSCRDSLASDLFNGDSVWFRPNRKQRKSKGRLAAPDLGSNANQPLLYRCQIPARDGSY